MERGAVFVPELTIVDYATFALLALLAAGCLMFAVITWRRISKSGARMGLAVSTCLVLGCLGTVMERRLPQLSEVEFFDREVVIRAPGNTVRMALEPGNEISLRKDSVMLVSRERVVALPIPGYWRTDNLVVGAKYLANEFRGRSLSTKN